MNPTFYFPLIIIGMGMIGIPAIWYFVQTVEERGKNRVRSLYAELVKEKLDIIRTAIAMGRDGEEIADLDARLEKLIGTEDMLKTLAKGEPDSETEKILKNVDLIEEVSRQSNNSVKEVD